MPVNMSDSLLDPSSIAVLWDMDGVLVDTAELHYQTWKQTLAGYGIPFSRQLFIEFFGMNNDQTLTRILGHPPEPSFLQESSDHKEDKFRKSIPGQIELYPGVRKLLQEIQRAGVRQAIASSAPQKNIDALVNELNLASFFQAIVSGHQLSSKPDPTTFLLAADSLGVKPQRCVVIEDALHGIEAARRAGMKCIAVATTNPVDLLSPADLVVKRINELSATQIIDLIT
ncbi:HAD family hydrolase [Chloroflexota bacterium]